MKLKSILTILLATLGLASINIVTAATTPDPIAVAIAQKKIEISGWPDLDVRNKALQCLTTVEDDLKATKVPTPTEFASASIFLNKLAMQKIHGFSANADQAHADAEATALKEALVAACRRLKGEDVQINISTLLIPFGGALLDPRDSFRRANKQPNAGDAFRLALMVAAGKVKAPVSASGGASATPPQADPPSITKSTPVPEKKVARSGGPTPP